MIPTKHTYQRGELTCVTPDYIRFLFTHDLVVDASEGGLIQGPSMAEGGIPLLGWTRDADVVIWQQVEGWQFLTNVFAFYDNEAAISQKSRYLTLRDALFQPYKIPDAINVLRVLPREVEGELITPVLFFGTNKMSIMPRVPARDNLSFLDQINRAAWQTHFVEKQPAPTLRDSALVAKWVPTELS